MRTGTQISMAALMLLVVLAAAPNSRLFQEFLVDPFSPLSPGHNGCFGSQPGILLSHGTAKIPDDSDHGNATGMRCNKPGNVDSWRPQQFQAPKRSTRRFSRRCFVSTGRFHEFENVQGSLLKWSSGATAGFDSDCLDLGIFQLRVNSSCSTFWVWRRYGPAVGWRTAGAAVGARSRRRADVAGFPLDGRAQTPL